MSEEHAERKRAEATSDEIDRAIDGVLRRMVAAPAPDHLRRRVIDRLVAARVVPERTGGPVWTGWPRVAWSAATVVLILAIGVVLLRDRSPSMPAQPSQAITTRALPGAAAPQPRSADAPVTEMEVEQRVARRSGSESQVVSAEAETLTDQIDPLPVPATLGIEPLAADSIVLSDLSIQALEVEALELAPLESASPPHP